MEKTARRKALFHKPTGKWVMIFMADALYGGAVDGIEEASLFDEDAVLSDVTKGVDFQFVNFTGNDFELRNVVVTYRTGE